MVDLDGTIADVAHRIHHLETRPKNWRAFFAAAPDDPVLEEGRRVLQALAGVYDVVYLSGRPEASRADTEAWLARHGLPSAPLRLRPTHDHRPARFFKLEALESIARTRTVAVVVDDDVRVLDDARAAGFDVLPADWAAESASLREAQESDGAT